MSSQELFRCDICPKSFETLSRYNQHVKTHTKPFLCDTCGRGFALRSDLNRHIQARHRVNFTKHSCRFEGCDFKATRKDNLRQHLFKSHRVQSEKSSTRGRKKGKTEKRKDENGDIEFIPRDSTNALGKATGLFDLFQAAARGNISVLEAALEGGKDLTIRGDDGSTLLHGAARAGQTDAVSYLLKSRYLVNAQNEKGRTPVHEAILSQSNSIFAILVDSGFDPCAKDAMGKSVLKYIADTDKTELAQTYFLKCSSTCDSWNLQLEAYSMLLASIRCSSPSLVRMLLPYLKTGSINDADRATVLAIRVATRCDRTDILEILLDFKQLHGINETEDTLMDFAAARGSAEVVKVLLSRVDAPHFHTQGYGYHGRTLLHLAAEAGNLEVVQLLLLSGHYAPDALCSDEDGLTALHLSIPYGHLEVLRAILEFQRGFQDFKDACLALDTAISYDQMSILQELLRQEDLQTYRRMIIPPRLQKAYLRCNWALVRNLLDYWNRTSTNENESVETFDLNPGSEGGQAIIKLFLKYDRSLLNDLDTDGESILHTAVWNADAPAVAYILSMHDVMVNLKAENGCTALHYAVYTGNLEILELLLAHEQTLVNGRAGSHLSVVFLLAKRQHNNLEAETILAKMGRLDGKRILMAGLEIATGKGGRSTGATAIHLAARLGHTEVVRRLLQCRHLDINMFADETYLDWPYRLSAVKGRDVTPLDIARERNHADIFYLLLAHGALGGKEQMQARPYSLTSSHFAK